MENQKVFLPGWKTIRLIGSGGFGKVYEIEKNDGSGVKSALKVISIPQTEDEYRLYKDDGYDDNSIETIFKNQAEDVISEFTAMSQFRGTSNIVSCEDAIVNPKDNGKGWEVLIRMELLTPFPVYLAEKEGTEEQLEEIVVKLGIDICSALELCSKKNIIHRDIKPHNIFVNAYGDYKLGDFGIAKTMDHTTHATKVGTFYYMAPEVYKSQPYNSSVDTYSLALVMYWLLNERRLPFVPLPPDIPRASEINEAMARRLEERNIPAPKNGSPKLKQIILKALSYDKKHRFASPTEMKKALEAIMYGDYTYKTFVDSSPAGTSSSHVANNPFIDNNKTEKTSVGNTTPKNPQSEYTGKFKLLSKICPWLKYDGRFMLSRMCTALALILGISTLVMIPFAGLDVILLSVGISWIVFLYLVALVAYNVTKNKKPKAKKKK